MYIVMDLDSTINRDCRGDLIQAHNFIEEKAESWISKLTSSRASKSQIRIGIQVLWLTKKHSFFFSVCLYLDRLIASQKLFQCWYSVTFSSRHSFMEPYQISLCAGMKETKQESLLQIVFWKRALLFAIPH